MLFHLLSLIAIKHIDALLSLLRDVDQVHDMMDDIAEQQDVAREISDAISNPVAFGNDIDEEELEKELEELEQEQLDKELLGIEPTDELPNVPATTLPSAPARTRTSSNLNVLYGTLLQ